MADDSITPRPLDIETLNALAVALDDHADGIEQVTLHKLEQDIRAAAWVASDMAHWRFVVAEVADALPFENKERIARATRQGGGLNHARACEIRQPDIHSGRNPRRGLGALQFAMGSGSRR